MKRIAPEADVIDITHGIAPQDVRHGASVLAETLGYMPTGVHLAVVDPGVGTDRRAVALEGGGRLYVGPDNGLLLPAAERLGGIDRAVSLENESYFLSPVSATFHGRDVFAPVAAHLACGVDVGELGPPLAAAELVRVALSEQELGDGRVVARVLAVDRFGNVQLEVRAGELDGSVRVDGRRVPVARTFADVSPGSLLAYVDSHRRLALALNGRSAAAELGLRPGDEVEVSRS